MVEFLLRRKTEQKLKTEMDKMSQSWVDKNYNGSKCHSVTNHLFFEVDKQFVHFGLECHSRKLPQGQSVTVLNVTVDKKIVVVLCVSGCRMVSLWVDVMSRHRKFPDKIFFVYILLVFFKYLHL
jgi:hypothetical protein